MKKSLLAVVAALAMTGCTQNEMDGIDTNRQESKTPISFNSVVMKNPRAVATTTGNFNAFTVNAYTSSGVWANAGTFYFTDDIAKTTDWAGTKTMYWPATANVHFFAYAPKDAATLATSDLTAYPTLTYTVPTAAADQKDLIAASTINKTKSADATSAVNLGFKHLLTQINFSVVAPTADLTYTIEEVKLTGVKNKGTFTYSDGTTTVGSWTLDATTAEYAYASTVEATTATDDEAITLGSESLMLLPQATATDLKISVTYSIKKDELVLLESTTKTVAVPAAWEMGKNISYKITLPTTGLETIKITGSISDEWGTATEATPSI